MPTSCPGINAMRTRNVSGEGMTLRAAMALAIMSMDAGRLAVRKNWVILIPNDRSRAVWLRKVSRTSVDGNLENPA